MSTEIYNRRQENLKSVLGEKDLDGILITNLTIEKGKIFIARSINFHQNG